MAQLVADNLDVVPGMQGMQVGSWEQKGRPEKPSLTKIFFTIQKPGKNTIRLTGSGSKSRMVIFRGSTLFFRVKLQVIVANPDLHSPTSWDAILRCVLGLTTWTGSGGR